MYSKAGFYPYAGLAPVILAQLLVFLQALIFSIKAELHHLLKPQPLPLIFSNIFSTPEPTWTFVQIPHIWYLAECILCEKFITRETMDSCHGSDPD